MTRRRSFWALFGLASSAVAMPPDITGQAPNIKWRGWLVTAQPYSGKDPGFFPGGAPDDILTDTTIEIGLRADGVVVWRRKEEKR